MFAKPTGCFRHRRPIRRLSSRLPIAPRRSITIPPTRATWDQIVSSGHIGLLDRDAAGQLAEHFAFDFSREANDLLVDSGYRKHLRSLIPLRVQEAIREGCSDIRSETALTNTFISIASFRAPDGFACKARWRRHSCSTSSQLNAAGGFVRSPLRACPSARVDSVVGA